MRWLVPVSVLCLLATAALAEPPLLARWTFDEVAGATCRDSVGGGYDARVMRAGGGVTRVEGLFGPALSLSGGHLVEVDRSFGFADTTQIGLSAWVRPRDLSDYREILRKEDGDQRVLFSFQGSGTILSLGLNVGGYAECDATVSPASLLDGEWRHCAASFDGEWYRVWLDGREVGRMHRPGTIAAGGPAHCCIGSSNGGENFDGALDDLRVYGGPLTDDDVLALFTEGLRARTAARERADDPARGERIAGEVARLLPPGTGFAERVGRVWAACRSGEVTLDLALARGLEERLDADNPEECRQLLDWAGISPLDVIADPSGALLRSAVERVSALALEYMPLTPEQWAQQSAEAAAVWRERDARAEELESLGDLEPSVDAVARQLAGVFALGGAVQARPWMQEPVAPWRTPVTPETRDLTADEASAVLRSDWLYQADGVASVERTLLEIGWARALGERLTSRGADVAAELAELTKLATEAEAATGIDEDLYLRVRAVKRRIVFRNPVLDFGSIVFTDSPYPDGSEWRHETRHRLGYMAVPGGRLLVLEGLGPDGHLRQLAPSAPLHGTFWRPDVSWDGTRVLFSMKPHNEKSFHLYEIGLDGSGFRQITRGVYDDLDPIYLPDERNIVYSTTAGHTYVRCMPPTNAFVLARRPLDGGDAYFISANNEPDYLPSVTQDGRILYTRWEYTDKPLWRAQKLWTVNPDGTQGMQYWGNQSVWPDLLKDAREIPGTHKVMFTGSAHHDWFAGSVGIANASEGLNFPWGLTKVTAETIWPECGNGPVDPIERADYHVSGRFGAYYSPYPLSEEDFLVSAERGGKFALYLMDTSGNRELVWEGAHNILHAMPVRARPKPPVLPDRVQWPTRLTREQPQDGVFFSGDVLQGADPAMRGLVRYLRVMAIDAKTYTYWHQRPYASTGPVVSLVQSEGVKRIIGTVPIAEDGSVSFRAPAGKALHFQLLDEQKRALQTMRSFAWVMPGEKRGCVGCHEQHSVAPLSQRSAEALGREPLAIEPPAWEDRTVGYRRYVQTTLDRYCGACHQGDGKARPKLDLTLRPNAYGMFDEPYATLIGHPTWGAPYTPPQEPPPGFGIADTLLVEGYSTIDPAAYTTPPAMSALSFRSRLVEIASSGEHHGVKVDPVSLGRLMVWVDAMCPWIGEDEIRQIPDPQFQGVDWLAIRPLVATAPNISRPGPLEEE